MMWTMGNKVREGNKERGGEGEREKVSETGKKEGDGGDGETEEKVLGRRQRAPLAYCILSQGVLL